MDTPSGTASSPLIVGIYSEGYGAGKDSFATTLVEEYRFTHYDFSKALKEHVYRFLTKQAFPTFEDWYAYCEAHKYDSPEQEGYWVRKLLQSWGQFHRFMDPNFWVAYWTRLVMERGYGRVVVPSVRYRNEAQRIKDMGGYIVKIERPGLAVDEDPSEHGMEGWEPDYTVLNNSSLDNLAEKARTIWDMIRFRQTGDTAYLMNAAVRAGYGGPDLTQYPSLEVVL